jgi:hypothetical protein
MPAPERQKRLVVFLAALASLLVAGALGFPTGAGTVSLVEPAPYPWPLKPFNRQHVVSAFFGDPRTVFEGSLRAGGELPRASFHNGIDILARAGTPVYPVVGGIVHLPSRSAVIVRGPNRQTFQYYHIKPAVHDGQYVDAQSTVLGYVLAWAGHLHFAEITDWRPRNPLARGHLRPYTDTTRPQISSLWFKNSRGNTLLSTDLSGRVDIVVEAFDRPPLRLVASRPMLPVAPAALLWSLTMPDGRVVISERAGLDFRNTIPDNSDFWDVYARGTYQNHAIFAGHAHAQLTGRYLFHVVPDLFNTRRLPNGDYTLNITAVDTRDNRSAPARVPLEIFNRQPA